MTETLELQLLRPAHGGYCVARHDGRVVFVRHGLPGERVLATVTQRRSKLWYADVTTVLSASAHRVAHVWPEAGPGGVGGAELGHVDYQWQAEWKSQVLADVLARIGGQGVADQVQEVTGGMVTVAQHPADVANNGLGGRTVATFQMADSGSLGMFKFRSKETAPVGRLPLLVDSLREALLGPAGLDLVKAIGLRAGDTLQAVAAADGAVFLTSSGQFSATGSVDPRARLRQVVRGDNCTYEYLVSPGGFWQSHWLSPEVLVQAVLQAAELSVGSSVLELYAGAGLLTLPLAQHVGQSGLVVSMENVSTAVDDARNNLRGYPQAGCFTRDVNAKSIALQWVQKGGKKQPDVVVLDPPRAGAGQEVMQAIAALQPAKIVYVACDPASAARDLKAGLQLGYHLSSFGAFDLFPHTHHFECVFSLTR